MKVRLELVLMVIFVSLVFGGVHLLRASYLTPGSIYTPLVTTGVDIHTVDEVFYAQRIQRAAFGKLLVGDRHFFEHRNEAYIFPTFTPFIFGLITRWLGNISLLFILADFIFPPMIFFLIYSIIYKTTRNYILSLSGSLTSLMYDIWQKLLRSFVLFNPTYFIQNVIGGDGRVLHLSRFESQEFVIPFILTAIVFLWYALEKNNLKYAIASGIIFGLNFYIYPYSVLFYAAGASIYGIIIIYRKLKTQLIIICSTLCIGLITGSLYIFLFVKFLQLPYAQEIIHRATVVEHFSYLEIIRRYGHYFLLSCLIFWFNKKPIMLFINSFFLGILLLLAFFPYGKTYHLDVYLGIWFPLVVFSIGGLKMKCWKISWQKKINVVLIVYFFLFLISGTYKHWNSTIESRGAFTLNNNVKESYDWMRVHTSPNSVVLSISLLTNRELPAYIPNYTFLGRSEFTYASSAEILDRLMIAYRYFSVEETQFKRLFTGLAEGITTPYNAPYTTKTIEELGVYYFLGPFGAKLGYNIDFLMKSYRNTSSISVTEILKKYKVDYIYLGPYERKLTKIDPNLDPELENIYTNSEVQIFQLKK